MVRRLIPFALSFAMVGCGGSTSTPKLDMAAERANKDERIRQSIEAIQNDPILTEEQKRERIANVEKGVDAELQVLQEAADAEQLQREER